MKYEIVGIKSGLVIKNYKLKNYYCLKNFKLIKKYRFKINFIKGKSGNLYTSNIDDIKDLVKITEEKMLKQLKELVNNKEIMEKSAKIYVNRNNFIFAQVSNAVTLLMPILTSIAYKNAFNLLFIIPNLIGKIYYAFLLNDEWQLIFYDDIEKYRLFLENQGIININELDNISLEELNNKIETKKLIKRR